MPLTGSVADNTCWCLDLFGVNISPHPRRRSRITSLVPASVCFASPSSTLVALQVFACQPPDMPIGGSIVRMTKWLFRLLLVALPFLPAAPVAANPLADELRQLVATHPEIKTRASQLEAAQAGIDRAFAGYLPKLDAVAQVGPQYIVTGRSGPPSAMKPALRRCVAKDVVNDVACGAAGCGQRS